MTDDLFVPLTPANPAAPKPRKCLHPRADRVRPFDDREHCTRCGHVFDPARSRTGRNNRNRGNRAELAIAREIGGTKMGPLGLPWDIEWSASRLQVKKLADRPSRNAVRTFIEAIPFAAHLLRGFVWVQAAGRGRRGLREASFLAAEWSMWHGPVQADAAGLVTMPLGEFVALHGRDEAVELPVDPYLASLE